MTQIPDRRKSLEELNTIRGVGSTRAVAPNAAFAKKPTSDDLPLSVGEWLITLIVLGIPVLNILLYIYWAFFSNGNIGRINFCRASLILSLILMAIGLSILLLLDGLT